MTTINLFDKKYTGGLNGARGYHFEDTYILSQLPTWLSLTGLTTLQQELVTDLELFFDSGERWFVQIKNHSVTVSELRSILSDIYARELSSNGEYAKYIIVSLSLSHEIERLHRQLTRFRDAKHYTSIERQPSRNEIAERLRQLDFDREADLIIDKLDFQSNFGWLEDRTIVQDRFTGAIARAYELLPRNADELFLRTGNLLISERGSAIDIRSIRDAISQYQIEYQAISFSQFELITPRMLDSYRNQQGASFFFDGATPTWHDIVNNRDVQRELSTGILPRLLDWHEGKVIVPILAEGGEGKSTVLRRIAVELSMNDRIVMYQRREVSRIDRKEIEFIAERSGKCIYILIDDIRRLQNFTDFVQALTELTVPIVLIVASRPYEWKPVRSAIYSSNLQVGLNNDRSELHLQGLTDNEIRRLFQLLIETERISPLSDDELDAAISVFAKRSKRKLLVLVLEITQDRQAAEIVRDEVERVRRMGRQVFDAYKYICLMSSIRCSITMSILRNLLGDDIELEIIDKLPGLVVITGDNVYARHDRIGEITTDVVFENADDRRGDTIIKLITHSFAVRQIEILTRMSHFLTSSLPHSQIERVLSHFIDEATCAGEFHMVEAVFSDYIFSNDSVSLTNLILKKTPIIFDVILGFANVKHINWARLQATSGVKYELPSCSSNPKTSVIQPTLEHGFRWAENYGHVYKWRQNELTQSQFLFRTIMGIYEALQLLFPNDKAAIWLHQADFLRDNWFADERHEEDSIELYRNVINANPDCAKAHMGLAINYYLSNRGTYAAALFHYRRVKEIDWSQIFRYDEEDLFVEMLQQFGLWNELIELIKEIRIRRNLISRKMSEFEWMKDVALVKKVIPDTDKHQNEPKPLRILDDAEIQSELDELDNLLEFVVQVSPTHSIEIGRQVFGVKWFGDLSYAIGEQST